jgi:hypothetical protein
MGERNSERKHRIGFKKWGPHFSTHTECEENLDRLVFFSLSLSLSVPSRIWFSILPFLYGTFLLIKKVLAFAPFSYY